MFPKLTTIRAQLKSASLLVLSILILNSLLSFWGMRQAASYLEKTSLSYEQLGVAAQLDGNINRFLLSELAALVHYQNDMDLAKTGPGVITQQLGRLQYLVDDEERKFPAKKSPTNALDDEPIAPSIALGSVFINMYRSANLERLHARLKTPDQAGRDFFQNVVEGKDKALSSLVHEIVNNERKEAEVSRMEMSRLRKRLGTLSLIMGLLSGIAFLGLLYLLGKSILTPITHLTTATTAFGAGQLSHRIHWHKSDEFGTVAQGFNDMASRLENQQEQLRSANEDLEKSVEERTKELQEAVKRLQTIDDSRKRFFANVSHELRTPLTILLGEAEVALRSKNTPKAMMVESFERIVANGSFLRRRLSDLLHLARSDEGDMSLSKGDLDIVEITQKAVESAGSYAKANEVELVSTLPDKPIQFVGDPSWLQHALLVLMDNGVKFSGHSGKVGVFMEQEGDLLTIKVRDSGSGLDEESLQRLFERYYQSEEGKNLGGSGLGLAIAQWIVHAHGGKISAQNGGEAHDYPGLCVQIQFDLNKRTIAEPLEDQLS